MLSMWMIEPSQVQYDNDNYKINSGIMTLTDKQWKLFDFVKEQHGNQLRKYTGDLYFIHLLKVMEILNHFEVIGEEIEIALCHDLLERTSCTKQQLAIKLKDIGYEMFPRNKMLKGIYDLTDIYTPQQYPDDSREVRKKREAERILDTEPFSQTVKYAELIDNIPSIVKYDPEFAWIYL